MRMNGKWKWLKAKARGIIGLGVMGGLIGFVGGAVWGLLSSMIRSGVFFDPGYVRFLLGMALGNAVGFMKIGGFTTAGFAVLLAAVDSRRSLDELPLWRMGVFGGLVGASFPPLYVIVQMGLSTYLDVASDLLPAMAALGGIGGILTSSMVAIAKRAGRSELPSAVDGPGSLPGVE